MNANFSFIILTLIKEIHLERLLISIAGLNAKFFFLDSGSDDNTLIICKDQNIKVKFKKFSNHAIKWDFVFKNLNVTTPWIIGLNADQVVTSEEYKKLKNCTRNFYEHFDGIYFNRKNYFQNQGIRHGEHFPKYSLEMFSTSIGYSDLSRNFHHRFMVVERTTIWTKCYLEEENLKENFISFRKSALFHFLESFCFRLVVNLKIVKRRLEKKKKSPMKSFGILRFILNFLSLYFTFYYFNIIFISLTTPDGYYISFFKEYLNYIQVLRSAYINCTAFILKIMDYKVQVSSYGLTVQNHAGFKLVYSCLGYGIISCFSAFALAIPNPFRHRYYFLLMGIISIVILNICRLVIVAIHYYSRFSFIGLDHHDIFNISTYTMIILCSYLYLTYSKYADK